MRGGLLVIQLLLIRLLSGVAFLPALLGPCIGVDVRDLALWCDLI